MTIQVTKQEFNLLRRYIEEQCGILLGEGKAYLIENRLSELAEKYRCKTFGEFYLKLKNSPKAAYLRNAVVDAISTNETLWFRDHHPFRILRERILPELRKGINNGKHKIIDIWSAACSTGQEPYSIAMMVHDFYLCNGAEEICRKQVRIFASDISYSSLSVAKEGHYNTTAMNRGMPSNFMRRYFRKNRNEWQIEDSIKNLITFKQLNLKNPGAGHFESFDIVFLRNVIIYFSDNFKKTLLDKIAHYLKPGGYLFVGTGESISSYTNAFNTIEDNGATFFQLKS